MFKQVKIIILPSKERARKGDLTFFGDKLVIASSILHLAQVSQHLFILSDEEIKVGDWCYDKVLNIVFQTDKYVDFKYVNQTDNVSKVIATTDKSLKITKDLGEISRENILPQLSQSFIEKYVEEYNKNNIITEVMVEYEQIHWKGNKLSYEDKFNLKINPKDNTITIQKVKDDYNREEVEYLLHLIVNDSHCGFNRVKRPNSNECAGFVNKWIETNL